MSNIFEFKISPIFSCSISNSIAITKNLSRLCALSLLVQHSLSKFKRIKHQQLLMARSGEERITGTLLDALKSYADYNKKASGVLSWKTQNGMMAFPELKVAWDQKGNFVPISYPKQQKKFVVDDEYSEQQSVIVPKRHHSVREEELQENDEDIDELEEPIQEQPKRKMVSTPTSKKYPIKIGVPRASTTQVSETGMRAPTVRTDMRKIPPIDVKTFTLEEVKNLNEIRADKPNHHFSTVTSKMLDDFLNQFSEYNQRIPVYYQKRPDLEDKDQNRLEIFAEMSKGQQQKSISCKFVVVNKGTQMEYDKKDATNVIKLICDLTGAHPSHSQTNKAWGVLFIWGRADGKPDAEWIPLKNVLPSPYRHHTRYNIEDFKKRQKAEGTSKKSKKETNPTTATSNPSDNWDEYMKEVKENSKSVTSPNIENQSPETETVETDNGIATFDEQE